MGRIDDYFGLSRSTVRPRNEDQYRVGDPRVEKISLDDDRRTYLAPGSITEWPID